MRGEPAYRHPRPFHDPRLGHTGPDHERRIGLALVREHVEYRPDIIRAYPRVRHVADELRRGRIAPHDLRPLIPARRPLIAEEPAEEVVGAIAPVETHHR